MFLYLIIIHTDQDLVEPDCFFPFFCHHIAIIQKNRSDLHLSLLPDGFSPKVLYHDNQHDHLIYYETVHLNCRLTPADL